MTKKDTTSKSEKEKAEEVEGAVPKEPFFSRIVPEPSPPATPDTAPFAATMPELETRVLKLEQIAKLPESYEARLTALERLVRSHAETIGNVKTVAP